MQNPKASLSGLPTELRDLIWQHTFSPTGSVLVAQNKSRAHQDLCSTLCMIPIPSRDHHPEIYSTVKLSRYYDNTYELLVHAEEDDASSGPEPHINLSLVRICKQFAAEIQPIFFAGNEFYCRTTDSLSDFLDFVTRRAPSATMYPLRLRYGFHYDGWNLDRLLNFHVSVVLITKFIDNGGVVSNLVVDYVDGAEEFESMIEIRSEQHGNLTYVIAFSLSQDLKQTGNLYADNCELLKALGQAMDKSGRSGQRRLEMFAGRAVRMPKLEELNPMVRELHGAFGGELRVNGTTCYKDGTEVVEPQGLLELEQCRPYRIF